MPGVMANSVSASMVDGDTSPDNTATGYLTGEQITLTVTDSDPASVSWGLSIPSNSAVASSGLDDDDVEVVHMTPDVGGYYTVTANVDGTAYVLRISVASVAQTTAEGVLGFQPLTNAQAPTPAAGTNLFHSSSHGLLSVKLPDGTVKTIDTEGIALGSTVVVNALSDLPTPVGGVITCEAKGYLFEGLVDIGENSLRAVTGTVFYGHSFAKDGIVRSGSPTGAMIEVPAGIGNCSIANLILDSTAGGVVLDAVPGTGGIFVIRECILYGDIGEIAAERGRVCCNVFLAWDQGLTLSGSTGITLEQTGNTFDLQTPGSTGVAVDITGTWSNLMHIFGDIYNVASTGRAIKGLASSGNLGANGVATLNSCRFTGRTDGAYLDTLDPDDARWTHSNNEGIGSSIAVCNYGMSGNSTATPDAGSGAWTKILGATSATLARRFTHTSNRATYDGRSRKPFRVDVELITDTDTNNTLVEFGISLNGSDPVSGVPETIPIGGNTKVSAYAVFELESVTPDYIEVWTRNYSGADITVTDLNVLVSALATGT